jgi:hypothetical protein
MLVATAIAIFLIPAIFYLVGRFSMRFGKKTVPETGRPAPEPAPGD